MSKLLILGVLLLHGCAAAIPIVSGVGSVRTEVRIHELEKKVEENTKILDFLLDYHKELH
mgnify:CR=1 FL=1